MTDDTERVEWEESNPEEVPEEESGADETLTAEPGMESAGPAPVEVISVEELLERLAASAEPEESEEEPEESEEPELPEPEPEEALPSILEVTGEGGGPLVVRSMDNAAQSLESLQETAAHPALTTPFADYTVTEALLLLLLLAVFLFACSKLLRGAFAWLRS